MHPHAGRSVVGRLTLAITASVLLLPTAAHAFEIPHDVADAGRPGSGWGQATPVDVDRYRVVVHTSPLAFIETSFENASPLWWELEDDHTIRIRLVYDHERESVNRANGHWRFRLEGTPGACSATSTVRSSTATSQTDLGPCGSPDRCRAPPPW
jgi:hypothetical protein